MTVKLGIVMDDINKIHIEKDTTFAFMLEAMRRGWEIYYCQIHDICYDNGRVLADICQIYVKDDPTNCYTVIQKERITLSSMDIILMRKDPPVNTEYYYATHLLELVQKEGTKVFNAPRALRDMNEKLAITYFLSCCTPTLVSSQQQYLRSFLKEQKEIVLKPLDSMGGDLIFRIKESDPNLSVIIDTITQQGQKTVMAQRYIPEIAQGDKRVILINGKPIDFALARIPAPGETRGNLAAGGKGIAVPLTKHDYWICEQVGEKLRDHGLIFVGLDIIGDYLTEINVTSPTCVRQLDQQCQINISSTFLDCLETYLS